MKSFYLRCSPSKLPLFSFMAATTRRPPTISNSGLGGGASTPDFCEREMKKRPRRVG
ncbi:unnamed protein product, partial [Larinioides sclopetarius]